MRNAPSDFSKRLQREFDGRLRVRWSTQRGEWQIEQRVARAHIASSPVLVNDDDGIRAQDGYAFVMSIREGDRMPCSRCSHDVRVPVMSTAEATCPHCKQRAAAAYFPLEGDALIQYLRRLDPLLDWHRELAAWQDDANAAATRAKERDVGNVIEASTKDHWNQLVGIPHVGYTGREQYQ